MKVVRCEARGWSWGRIWTPVELGGVRFVCVFLWS